MTPSFPPVSCTSLPQRALVALEGADRTTFLQGLVSNDVTKVTAEQGVYALFLTPQGRFLRDLFITERNDTLFLETERDKLADFIKKLSLFRLKAKVTITEATDWNVSVLFGDEALAHTGLADRPAGSVAAFRGGWALADPRLPNAGVRLYLPAGEAVEPSAPFAVYDRFRLMLGLPDGSRDLPVDKAIPLENGMDELNAVDWKKGCYMGQELTARTRYRGLVRKRLLPVTIDGPLPAPGSAVLLGDQEAGVMHSSHEGFGLALLRLEKVQAAQKDGTAFTCDQAHLTPFIPDWMRLPAVEETTGG